eukprot:1258903-Pyramimonas_sp.AAC.1
MPLAGTNRRRGERISARYSTRERKLLGFLGTAVAGDRCDHSPIPSMVGVPRPTFSVLGYLHPTVLPCPESLSADRVGGISGRQLAIRSVWQVPGGGAVGAGPSQQAMGGVQPIKVMVAHMNGDMSVRALHPSN